MAEPRKYGRATIGEVRQLPEVVVDMTEGTASGDFGRAGVPQPRMHPDIVVDFQAMPVLELRLSFRTGIAAAEVALDLHRLYKVVNDLELSHGGNGLMPASEGEAREAEGEVRVRFVPANPEGAWDRLRKVVAALNAPEEKNQTYRAIKGIDVSVAA